MTAPESEGLLRRLSDVLATLSRDGERDLTLRQLAVFLICCTEARDKTAKELSDALDVTAPGGKFAFDVLLQQEYMKRFFHEPD